MQSDAAVRELSPNIRDSTAIERARGALARSTQGNIKIVLACVFLHNICQRDSAGTKARLSVACRWHSQASATFAPEVNVVDHLLLILITN